MGDAQPRGQADLPGAVGDQHHDPGARVRLALEVFERLFQPGADVGLGEPAPHVAGRDRRGHHLVVIGEPQHRYREGAEHHHPEQVVVPVGDELGEEPARYFSLGSARTLRRRIDDPLDGEGPVHAGAAIDQEHHVGSSPDPLDLVGGPVQAARGERQRRDGEHPGRAQRPVEPA